MRDERDLGVGCCEYLMHKTQDPKPTCYWLLITHHFFHYFQKLTQNHRRSTPDVVVLDVKVGNFNHISGNCHDFMLLVRRVQQLIHTGFNQVLHFRGIMLKDRTIVTDTNIRKHICLAYRDMQGRELPDDFYLVYRYSSFFHGFTQCCAHQC